MSQTVRLDVIIPEDRYEDLKRLAELTEADSVQVLVQRALGLYHLAVDLQQSGGRLVAEEKDGVAHHVKLKMEGE